MSRPTVRPCVRMCTQVLDPTGKWDTELLVQEESGAIKKEVLFRVVSDALASSPYCKSLNPSSASQPRNKLIF